VSDSKYEISILTKVNNNLNNYIEEKMPQIAQILLINRIFLKAFVSRFAMFTDLKQPEVVSSELILKIIL